MQVKPVRRILVMETMASRFQYQVMHIFLLYLHIADGDFMRIIYT